MSKIPPRDRALEILKSNWENMMPYIESNTFDCDFDFYKKIFECAFYHIQRIDTRDHFNNNIVKEDGDE